MAHHVVSNIPIVQVDVAGDAAGGDVAGGVAGPAAAGGSTLSILSGFS